MRSQRTMQSHYTTATMFCSLGWIRTSVPGVRNRCATAALQGIEVPGRGIEPRLTASKAALLPLEDPRSKGAAGASPATLLSVADRLDVLSGKLPALSPSVGSRVRGARRLLSTRRESDSHRPVISRVLCH